jgi:hypothetical protein
MIGYLVFYPVSAAKGELCFDHDLFLQIQQFFCIF